MDRRVQPDADAQALFGGEASTRTFSVGGTKSDVTQSGWATAEAKASPAPASLACGAVLASRFRIDRLLGKGGVGEVYEARDLELDVSVALKTLRRERMTDADAMGAIKRELAIARQVTHPGVARVFDFAVHAKDGQLGFLTMELLVGEPLSEALRRDGPWPEAEVVALGIELCDALAAIHDAGIVHRDFKSANVLLVETGAGGRRAVVTDLGLATTLAAGAAVNGARSGTPAYMAPEQVRGEPVDPRTDLFALGVVLFELLTGRRPFEGPSLEEMMNARLTSRAPRLRAFRPKSSPAIDQLVAALLEADPRARPASAREVATALGRIRRAPRRSRTRLAAVAASIVAAVGLGALGLAAKRADRPAAALAPQPLASGAISSAQQDRYEGQPNPAAQEAAPSRVRSVVAVLPATGPEASGAALVTEALAQALSASDPFRSLSVATSARAMSDLGLPPGVPTAPADREHLAKLLGADKLLHVAGVGEGGALQVTLVGVGQKGEYRREWTRDIAATNPIDAADRVIEDVLGLEKPALTAAVVRTVIPASPPARLSLETLLRSGSTCSDADLARAGKATESHLWSLVKLAECAEQRGNSQAAHRAAEEAFARSSELPLELRPHVEMTLGRQLRQWVDVAAAARRTLDENPDDIELRLLLAEALTRSSDGARALEVLRATPTRHRETPRTLLAKAAAYQALYDNTNARDNARAAYRLAAELGARRTMAEARLAEASAAKYQGRFAEALEAVREAKKVFETVSSGREVILALDAEGDTLLRMAQYDEAERVNRQMQERARSLGEPAFVGLALHDAARILLARQQFVAARKTGESALAIFERAGDATHEMWALELLADIDGQLGAYDSSFRRYERALRLAKELGAREDEGIGHHNLGERLHARFELKRAEQEFDYALELFEPMQSGFGLFSRMWKARTVLSRGDPRRAASHARAALDVATATGNRSVQGRAHVLLAEVAFAAGERDTAEAEARRSIEILDAIGEPLEAAEARLTLSQILAWDGSEKEARELSEAALQVASSAQALRVLALAYAVSALAVAPSDAALARTRTRTALETAAKLETGDRVNVMMLVARALLASRDPSAASVATQALGASARAGALERELEAKLVIAKAKRRAAAESELRAIEDTANAAGLVRLARATESARLQ